MYVVVISNYDFIMKYLRDDEHKINKHTGKCFACRAKLIVIAIVIFPQLHLNIYYSFISALLFIFSVHDLYNYVDK